MLFNLAKFFCSLHTKLYLFSFQKVWRLPKSTNFWTLIQTFCWMKSKNTLDLIPSFNTNGKFPAVNVFYWRLTFLWYIVKYSIQFYFLLGKNRSWTSMFQIPNLFSFPFIHCWVKNHRKTFSKMYKKSRVERVWYNNKYSKRQPKTKTKEKEMRQMENNEKGIEPSNTHNYGKYM